VVLETPKGSRVVETTELWERLADAELWNGVPRDGSRQTIHAVFVIARSPQRKLIVMTPGGKADVNRLTFDGDLWLEVERAPVGKARSYVGPEGEIARSAYFSFDEGRLTIVMHLIGRSAERSV